jgi:hypothetical protein
VLSADDLVDYIRALAPKIVLAAMGYPEAISVEWGNRPPLHPGPVGGCPQRAGGV